ncbi:MAG: hypothetical protein ACI9BD_000972, partial [Candidatus Marinamargulisbacteria bacterium]
MKRSGFLIVLLLCAFPYMAAAQSAEYMMITDVGSSAKMVRMGNVEGFSEMSSSVFDNPAGLY